MRQVPFHCGSQGLDWFSRNCERCDLSPRGVTSGAYTPTCEIEKALSDAFYTGVMPDGIAARMGAPTEVSGAWTWDCPERRDRQGAQGTEEP